MKTIGHFQFPTEEREDWSPIITYRCLHRHCMIARRARGKPIAARCQAWTTTGRRTMKTTDRCTMAIRCLRRLRACSSLSLTNCLTRNEDRNLSDLSLLADSDSARRSSDARQKRIPPVMPDARPLLLCSG